MQKMLRSEIEQTQKCILSFILARSESRLNKQELLSCQSRLKDRIMFFQHERLIHLLVTFLIALLTFSTFVLVLLAPSIPVIIIAIFMMSLFIPYIIHYYHLENGVQKLYQLYDELLEIGG